MAFDDVDGRVGLFSAKSGSDFEMAVMDVVACSALCLSSRPLNPSRDSTAYRWRTVPACHASLRQKRRLNLLFTKRASNWAQPEMALHGSWRALP